MHESGISGEETFDSLQPGNGSNGNGRLLMETSFARFPESGGRAGVTVNKLHGEVNLTHVLPNSETHLVAKESCCRVLGRGHG